MTLMGIVWQLHFYEARKGTKHRFADDEPFREHSRILTASTAHHRYHLDAERIPDGLIAKDKFFSMLSRGVNILARCLTGFRD